MHDVWLALLTGEHAWASSLQRDWLLSCAVPCRAVLCCAGSSEADELVKIAAVLGTPTNDSWPEGLRLAAAMDFR